MKTVWIIIERNKNINDWTAIRVDEKSFENKQEAIEYCKSKLNESELIKYEKLLKRGLISELEFETEKYSYNLENLYFKECE